MGGLASSDLDIFSAPLSRGFLVVSISLFCQSWKITNPPELYTCIFHTHSLILVILQSRSLPAVFSSGTVFFWTEVKILPLPENCPISIGLATAVHAIGLYTQSLFTCHEKQSRVLYKLEIRQKQC